MTFSFSQASLDNLVGVHPDLVKVCNAALDISAYDFGIIEGVRTLEKEQQMVSEGKSQTLNSRHLTGKAVDFAAFVGGAITWEQKYYEQIANAFYKAAAQLQIPIVWGGSWKTLADNDHVELNKSFYP